MIVTNKEDKAVEQAIFDTVKAMNKLTTEGFKVVVNENGFFELYHGDHNSYLEPIKTFEEFDMLISFSNGYFLQLNKAV